MSIFVNKSSRVVIQGLTGLLVGWGERFLRTPTPVSNITDVANCMYACWASLRSAPSYFLHSDFQVKVTLIP